MVKRVERVRWFQPPWRTVVIYSCDSCQRERRILQNGSSPMVGGIVCECGKTIDLSGRG